MVGMSAPASFWLLLLVQTLVKLLLSVVCSVQVKYFTETGENTTMMAPRSTVPYFL